jgi:hypothetical protein
VAFGCSNSFKKETLEVAKILSDAYGLEQTGSPKEDISNDGSTKVIVIPSDKKMSKKLLIEKRKDIAVLYEKLNSYSTHKDNEYYFDSIFLKTVINLDYHYLNGKYFDEHFSPQNIISEADLQNVSGWVIEDFYSNRMPEGLRKDWKGMDKASKLTDIYENILFLSQRRQ